MSILSNDEMKGHIAAFTRERLGHCLECAAKDREITEHQEAYDSLAERYGTLENENKGALITAITERKAAESALAEASTRLELLRSGTIRQRVNVHYADVWKVPRRVEKLLWYVRTPDCLYEKLDDALDAARKEQE